MRLTSASDPEPDLLLLRYRGDFYRGALPRPADILLVVEVAESSVASDRDFKIPRYAQAGIAECWLVQTQERVVTVYREPAPRGYARAERFGPDAAIAPAAFPDASVPLRELFAGSTDAPA
jgi:Uma2 family endonuclease